MRRFSESAATPALPSALVSLAGLIFMRSAIEAKAALTRESGTTMPWLRASLSSSVSSISCWIAAFSPPFSPAMRIRSTRWLMS
jgi:hypothetical protein